MEVIIQHTINYTLEELINMVKQKKYINEYENTYDGKPVYQILESTLLPGEIFRNHPNLEKVEVSNLGRIKIDNKIIEQYNDHPNGKGWLYVKLNKISHSEFAYRFVAETWCECPKILDRWEVHHITNNGYDNRPNNLIWVRKEWHAKIPTK